jgi:mitochondrial fission protein ELM1
MTDRTDAPRPRVWLLIDDRPGHRTQVLGAARALDWPAEEKILSFNKRERLPNPLLGATLSTLDRASRQSIAPPFPDVVIGMGRRVSPVARWIKRASAGRTRVVLLGRKTPGDFADLTARCAHFQQPPHPGLFELVVPPTQVDAATLDRVRSEEPDPMAGGAEPRVLFLVGGATTQHHLSEAFAERMVREIADATQGLGGSLFIVTSRRTGEAAVAGLKRGAPGAQVHEWRRDAAYNPFLAYLANADLIVVTGESESMLAEAVATAKPLTIYPLIERPTTRKGRLAKRVSRLARGRSALAPFARRLLRDGWVTPRRDLGLMHRLIAEHGWGRVFEGKLNRAAPAPHAETETLARHIAALITRAPETSA